MELFSYRQRKINSSFLTTNDAGNFFSSGIEINTLAKQADNHSMLLDAGMGFESSDDVYYNAHSFEKFRRLQTRKNLDYFIIIPTLRCNLSCSYCQVSRANENATGYDWTEEQYNLFLQLFEKHSGHRPKIEIQGGEPMLVFDRLITLFERLKTLRPNCQIVVCSNLQQLPAKFFDICNKFDLQISSSLDGPPEIHDQNRNQNKNSTASFFENLSACIDALGPKRVSLLPTISEFGIMEDIARTYIELGLNEIFLRPVNYQGFARKKHKNSQSVSENWLTHYISFLKWLFEFNEGTDNQLIETNFSIHLKRIFEPNFNSHVDFRNPNPVGQDYIVVNFDGRIFPTDEARMLERIGIIDLSIGNLEDGIHLNKVEELNKIAKLDNFEACNRCAYKPFCGVDIVDLISKEGTLNVDMLETDHCKIHMSVFDFIFTQISSNTAIFRKNMNLHLTGQYSDTHLLIGSTYD